MEQFVAAYAADARSGEVRDWLLDIQSQYLFSRLRNRAMRATLTEVQQAYVEAMKRLETQPQSARDRLEALLSNFAEVPDEADPITCLEAARHQVKRLSAILPDNASDQ